MCVSELLFENQVGDERVVEKGGHSGMK